MIRAPARERRPPTVEHLPPRRENVRWLDAFLPSRKLIWGFDFHSLTKARLVLKLPTLLMGYFMDSDFCREQALRARDLAEKADQFTRKRLLALADRYDAKASGPSRVSRMIKRPAPLPLEWPIPTRGLSGEA